MPPRLHRRLLFKLRYCVSPTSLKTSFSPLESLRGLKAHPWTRYDAQYVLLVAFPCSPPWYENLCGLAPANYSIPGSPAGLARIDELLGMDLYTSGFTASPMVFGAFPSLHAASATLEALFLSYVFPKLRPVWILYTLWLWWAAMYLSHHYAVDLVAGSLLAVYVFYYTRIYLSHHTQVSYLPR